ncbi:MAG: pyrroloquinoline quinone biosynthesis protein PqqE [Polyangiaceae bacterium]
MIDPSARPKLASKAKLRLDPKTNKQVLLYPEKGLELNATGGAIVSLCNGELSFAEIVGAAAAAVQSGRRQRAREPRGGVPDHAGSARPDRGPRAVSAAAPDRIYTLIAELTYRCPLRCPYCSNPLDFQQRRAELSTDEWLRVLDEAAELGALQVNFSGGEPLLRDDLERLLERARSLQLYSSLITSGVPLERERLVTLKGAGLDALQLSLQDSREADSDRIAGMASYGHKLEVARWVKELGLPLTLNVVLHRQNLEHIEEIVALGERLGADRLELANTQYLGWALENRTALLPSREQIDAAREVARAAKQRLLGRMELLFVLPDYYSDRPKACMGGWGQRYLLITPEGQALPCHLAHTLPGLQFENVKGRPLAEIWRDSPGFNAFRGEAWMPEPCRSCDRRAQDFGGCRCQAQALLGDARLTDPTCALSPHHGLIGVARSRAVREAEQLVTLRYRGARAR